MRRRLHLWQVPRPAKDVPAHPDRPRRRPQADAAAPLEDAVSFNVILGHEIFNRVYYLEHEFRAIMPFSDTFVLQCILYLFGFCIYSYLGFLWFLFPFCLPISYSHLLPTHAMIALSVIFIFVPFMSVLF